MVMSPRAYAEKYQNLDVYLYTDEQAKAANPGQLPPGGTWTAVSVHSYRLGLKKAHQRPETSIEVFKSKVRPHIDNKGESITVWVRTIAGDVVSKTYASRWDLAENVNDPFYGKGSPEEVQVVLQLAVRYGVFPREKVQIYCDNGNIGLDCNGFIGNYLRHVHQGLPWDTDARSKTEKKTEIDANTLIASIMKFGKLTIPVKAIADIEQFPWNVHLLAMANEHGHVLDHLKNPDGSTAYGHIMISEPGTQRMEASPVIPGLAPVPDRALGMTVFESAGGVGLVESKYYILSVNKHGAFKIYRGSKASAMTAIISRLL